MLKLDITTKGYCVYVSLLKQQGTVTLNSLLSDFRAVTIGYIRYQHTIWLKSYDLKIESFSFLLVAVST